MTVIFSANVIFNAFKIIRLNQGELINYDYAFDAFELFIIFFENQIFEKLDRSVCNFRIGDAWILHNDRYDMLPSRVLSINRQSISIVATWRKLSLSDNSVDMLEYHSNLESDWHLTPKMS